jgi:hypothetical protein
MTPSRQTLALAMWAGTIFTPAIADAQARRTAPAAVTYQCEGSMARVTSSPLAGQSRSDWSINFGLRIDRNAGSVVIFGVSGTRIIKPGRYTLARDNSGIALQWTWTDSSNVSQPVAMTIDREGNFEGSFSETDPTARSNAMLGTMMSGLFGADASGITDAIRVSSNGTFSGVCWS